MARSKTEESKASSAQKGKAKGKASSAKKKTEGAKASPASPVQRAPSKKSGATTGMARYGKQRPLYEKNRKKILAAQDVCGICGRPVDKSLRWPHPMSACVDHIIPVDKGGDSSIENLQLAHMICNREKSDKLIRERREVQASDAVISNRILPHSLDWKSFGKMGG